MFACALSIGISITTHIGFSHNNFNDIHPYINCQHDKGEYVGLTINSFNDPVVYYGNKFIDSEGDMVDAGIVIGYHTSPTLPYIKLGTETHWAMPADLGNDGFAWVVGTEGKTNETISYGWNHVVGSYYSLSNRSND